MRVDHIDLDDIAYHAASNCHVAKIHLVGPDTDVTFDCAAYLAPEQSKHAVASALISDAIRQLHRLNARPRDKKTLTFAPGALPDVARKLI